MTTEKLYFMGIAGTGMAAVAGLCKEAGYQVEGSDANVYPPMSTLLETLEIPVATPYNPENLKRARPDRIIIANALSRGHEELEAALATGLPYTSFPALLGELFLSSRPSVVITGTHGKTTTSSLMAHVLTQLDLDPSFIIGGLPKNFPRGFHLGAEGQPFVLEGDEYDTAFFDKEAKFLHYKPRYLIINNIEFDHADIFETIDDIKGQFLKLVALVHEPRNICANKDDPHVVDVIRKAGLSDLVTWVSPTLGDDSCQVRVINSGPVGGRWGGRIHVEPWGDLEVDAELWGPHNYGNIAMALAVVSRLAAEGLCPTVTPEGILSACSSFAGVTRRMDLLARRNDITVYEDFAHHPTAVAKLLQSYKQAFPARRLLACFEPKNATSRRNVFERDYVAAFQAADGTYLGQCPEDSRIEASKRMDTKRIAQAIGSSANAFETNEDLLAKLKTDLQPGDTVIFMSSGSFSGIQHKLAAWDLQ